MFVSFVSASAARIVSSQSYTFTFLRLITNNSFVLIVVLRIMAGKDPKRRVTLSQLNVLWEHLNAHRDIALGHNKSAHARDHSRRLWQEVAEALNSMGEGATKSWKEWSSYWVDYKAKLKKKVSSMRAAMSGTGGGPSNAPVLQDIEKRFLDLLGAGFGSGIPGVRVDPFPEMQQEADPPEEDVEMEYIIVPEDAPLSPAGSEPYRIVAATPPQPTPPSPPPRPPTPPPPAQGPVRHRRTRRHMADADRLDARSARRLLLDNNQERLEGQRELREILASIRDSLIRISDTIERIDRSYNSTEGFRSSEQLGFPAAPSEDEDYQAGYLKKGKVSRQDPMSHRIIEKRRRDRMNNCLADLSRLIPPEYLKKGRGRVEKTEIIEMAIRHLKFLKERANAAERVAVEEFRAGFQEALAEAARFLVEVQGYGPADGLCVQLAAHLQRHAELIAKGEAPRDKSRLQPGSSSETASSTCSSLGYPPREGVIARRPEPPPQPEPYEPLEQYPMECDRVPNGVIAAPEELPPDGEPMALDGRRKREPTLRAIRKPEHSEDFLHSYKFKNSIERRFSRSQDCEAADMTVRGPQHKGYGHKRRRQAKPAPSSTSNSGSTEDARDTSPQDTSSESPHHHYDKPVAPPAQYVPVFALNSLGKYYVPLSVDYACLSRHLGPYDVLDARASHQAAPLHPVTIHVNFQPCLNYHVKREPNERDWRPV